MRALRVGLVLACGLLMALGNGVWAEEGAPPPPEGKNAKARPEGFRPGGGRPEGAGPFQPGGPGGFQRPGGPGGPPDMLGFGVPAVEEEMKRHREAMRDLMKGDGELRDALRDQLRELIKQGAGKEEILALVKQKGADKAKAVAQKLAAELAQHHQNMAKIYQEEGIADKLAESMVERLAKMAAARRDQKGPRPEGPGGPGGPPRPEGKKGAPENF